MSVAELRAHSQSATVGDYVSLLKPRVMSLVLFTALAGLVVAPGKLDPVLMIASLLAIAAGAGGSAALNMWYDADIDRLMRRTHARAVPAGRVAPSEAVALGIALSLFSVLALMLAANYLAAVLLAFTIFFYAVVYTMALKRATPENIVIGGAAGALPPVIGWAAATGHVPLEAWSLFLVVFLWTPAHFWSLAVLKKDEFAAAGIPMMPNARGERATCRGILFYAVLTVLASLLPLTFSGWLYTATAVIAGALFVAGAWRVFVAKGASLMPRAGRMFALSIAYLFALFAALMVDRLIDLSPLLGQVP